MEGQDEPLSWTNIVRPCNDSDLRWGVIACTAILLGSIIFSRFVEFWENAIELRPVLMSGKVC
jgi:hypothetical protein